MTNHLVQALGILPGTVEAEIGRQMKRCVSRWPAADGDDARYAAAVRISKDNQEMMAASSEPPIKRDMQETVFPDREMNERTEQGVKVLVPADFSEHYRNQIEEACPHARVVSFKLRKGRSGISRWPSYELIFDDPAFRKEKNEVTVCVAPSELPEGAAGYLVQSLPALRWLHSTRTGVEHLLNDEVRRRNIILTSPHVCSEAIAEYVLAMLLAAAKEFPVHSQLQRTTQWTFVRSRTLQDQRAGVLGLGRIGRAVARRLKANGMEVWGWNRSKPDLKELDHYLPAHRETLKKLCGDCDYIVVTLPLTVRTHHLLDVEILEAMKRDAWLINISRGGIVDQKALYWRLKRKQLGGACLDVLEDTSKPALEKFAQLDNVLLTHYSSFYFPEYNQAVCEDFLAKLKCYLAGRPLPDVVDVQSGY